MDSKAILEGLIDLGRQIINKGLSLRRAIDNITPDQFARTLSVGANKGLITVQGSGFEFDPPPGEFRGDVDRIEWVEGRKTVIRELAVLDYDCDAWLTGAKAAAAKLAPSVLDPLLWTNFASIQSEVRKLRGWTVPAGEYAKGNLPPVGGGSSITARVAELMEMIGVSIDRILDAAPKVALGFLVVVVALVVLVYSLRGRS